MSKIPLSNTDWDSQTVVGSRARVGGSGPRTGVARSTGALNSAMRSGNVLSTEKKFATGNHSNNPEGQRLAKIDRDDNAAPPPKVSLSVGRAIQQGRQAKNLSQKDLATAIAEKPQIVSEYESGKGIPNQQVLGKMEKKLGVKLRGKDIGSPLPGKGTKKN